MQIARWSSCSFNGNNLDLAICCLRCSSLACRICCSLPPCLLVFLVGCILRICWLVFLLPLCFLPLPFWLPYSQVACLLSCFLLPTFSRFVSLPSCFPGCKHSFNLLCTLLAFLLQAFLQYVRLLLLSSFPCVLFCLLFDCFRTIYLHASLLCCLQVFLRFAWQLCSLASLVPSS